MQEFLRPIGRHPGNIALAALTGGPCVGKTTVRKRLETDEAGHVLCIPELVTELRGWRMPPPGDVALCQAYDERLAVMQHAVEELAIVKALEMGVGVVAADRGVLDKGAYMPNGRVDLMAALRSFHTREFARYDVVICLEPPPEEIFRTVFVTEGRDEADYVQALEVHRRTVAVYEGHPRFVTIGNDGGMEGKYEQVREILRGLAAR